MDLQKPADRSSVRIPSSPGKYPKIVKYVDGHSSMKLDHGSIYHDEEAFKKPIAFMEKDNTISAILKGSGLHR